MFRMRRQDSRDQAGIVFAIPRGTAQEIEAAAKPGGQAVQYALGLRGEGTHRSAPGTMAWSMSTEPCLRMRLGEVAQVPPAGRAQGLFPSSTKGRLVG
jgi:hypothetical protein